MIEQVVGFIERLNLAYPKSIIGGHFQEIMGILSIIFGGIFLLFSYKHYEYFAGITGFLLGGWLGIIIKNHFFEGAQISHFFFVLASALFGAVIALFFKRIVGMMLGGFLCICLVWVASPTTLTSYENKSISLVVIFLLGSALGTLFPKFFFILNSSLIGSIFVTYGFNMIVANIYGSISQHWSAISQLVIFLPTLIFGILYQMITNRDAEDKVTQPAQEHAVNVR